MCLPRFLRPCASRSRLLLEVFASAELLHDAVADFAGEALERRAAVKLSTSAGLDLTGAAISARFPSRARVREMRHARLDFASGRNAFNPCQAHAISPLGRHSQFCWVRRTTDNRLRLGRAP